MKKQSKIIFLLTFLLAVCSVQAAQKYNRGACITPVSNSYTWYGQYAKVEAFSKIEGYGFGEKSYILSFPKTGSSSVIFRQITEENTTKAEDSKCY